jgi:hypothetical protein
MTESVNAREGYMCQIDFDHELGESYYPSKIYSDLESLKAIHKCWRGCGIVKVSITMTEVIVPQDLDLDDGED